MSTSRKPFTMASSRSRVKPRSSESGALHMVDLRNGAAVKRERQRAHPEYVAHPVRGFGPEIYPASRAYFARRRPTES